MARKVTEQEFLKRFNFIHKDADITLVNYTAISKPVDIRCNKCGKVSHFYHGNAAINNFHCCENYVSKCEKIKSVLEDNSEFEYVDKTDSEYVLIKHNVCGNTYKRSIQKFFANPFACQYCDTRSKRIGNTLEQAQENVDNIFNGQIQLLQYNGRHEKTLYRCLKCGQIFKQKYDCLLMSSGCPKCDKRQSQGEKYIAKLLESNNIVFKEQVAVKELSRQHFDFAVYDEDYNKIKYFIEVQGEQHYRPVKYWGGIEKFERVVTLDNAKREYCKKHNIPLYELIYENKQFKNLDILPFSSTTIPANGSTQ